MGDVTMNAIEAYEDVKKLVGNFMVGIGMVLVFVIGLTIMGFIAKIKMTYLGVMICIVISIVLFIVILSNINDHIDVKIKKLSE